MTCPNCGRENAESSRFCVGCGMQLENVAQTQPVQPEEPMQQEQPVQQQEAVEEPIAQQQPEAPAEPESESAYDRIEEILQDKPVSKKKLSGLVSKIDLGIVKKIGIAAIAVIVLVILVSCLRGCLSSSDTLDVESLPIIYGADDEIKFIMAGQKEGNEIEDRDDVSSVYTMSITSDGKYIFYGSDPDGGEFDLCYRPVSKKDSSANKEIVSGITDYMITPDGETIVYIKNNDIYRCSRNGKNPLRLAKDFAEEEFDDPAVFDITDDFSAIVYQNDEDEIFYSTGVDKIHNEIGGEEVSYALFSDNGKKILLVEETEDDDTYEINKTVSICGTGKRDKAKTLESKVSDYVMADKDYGSMYYVKKDKLYLKKGTKEGKEVEGIEDDVVMISSAPDDKQNIHFYAISRVEKDDGDEYNLYYIEGGKAKLVLEDIGTSYYYGEKIIESSKYDDSIGEYKAKHYVRVEYDKFVEIDLPEDDGNYVDYYYTENNFYTIENVNDIKDTGDLVKYEITTKGIDFSKGVTIAEDVADVNTNYAEFFDEETIFIKHDDEEYSVYNGGKKATEIDADVHEFLWFSKDGTMLLGIDVKKDYTYTLARFDGKKVVEIADDVVEAVVLNEKTIYYIDGSDELYFNKGKLNRDKKIDEDIEGILHPIGQVAVEEDTKIDFVIPNLYFN